MALCPSCQKKVISPVLKSKPYLVVKESLTQNEIGQELPFALNGKNKHGRDEQTTSYYLMKELGMVGINFQQLSLTALWMHHPPKIGRTKESKVAFQACLDYSISQVIKAAEGKQLVMLLGAEVVRTFTGYGVSEVSGLKCKSDLLPNVPVVIPAHNPDNIMKMPIGELRNALKVFAEEMKIYEEYSKA